MKSAAKHDVHVTQTPGDHGWRVSQYGRTLRKTAKQSVAVETARRYARRARVDLVVHTRTGRIRAIERFRKMAESQGLEP